MATAVESKSVPSLRLKLPAALRPVLIGAAFGLGFILLVSLFSGPVLSKDRAARLSLAALSDGSIPSGEAAAGQDYFTDCTFLATLEVRSDSAVTNAVAMWRPDAVYWHPCEGLVSVATHHVPWDVPSQQAPYVNYPFGSRYIEAFALAVFDYGTAQNLWRIASYLAVVALFVGARLNNRRMAYLTLPLYVSLGFFFGQQLFGHSFSHAPGFIFGFGMLALMLGARRTFERFSNRAALFVALALVMTYFDLLSGGLLVMLSLSLALNHLFYLRPQAESLEPHDYLKTTLTQALTIVACFLGGYVFLTGLHLALVSLVHDGALQAFREGLAVRTGSSDGANEHITVIDLANRLWLRRDRLTPLGTGAATLFLLASAASWLFAAVTAWRAVRNAGRPVLCDLGVVLVAASGVMAWYLLFTNHSFIHAWFAVRFLAVPAGLGFVAALLVLERLRLPSLSWRATKPVGEVTAAASMPVAEG